MGAGEQSLFTAKLNTSLPVCAISDALECPHSEEIIAESHPGNERGGIGGAL
jgi:hypothetical protein